jgi:hypothetical protein
MKRRYTYQPPDRWNGQVQRPCIVLSRARDLVQLDTHAIRHKSLKDYRKAERSLDELKSQLKRFREQDTPGFRAWLHQTFGSLLTRQRELAQAIHEKQDLLMEIEELADRYRLSDVAAYRKAQWRRAHPEEAQAEDLRFEEEMRRRQEAQGARPGEAPDPCDDAPGLDDRFDDDEFGQVPDDDWNDFSDFFETMTGIRPPPRSAKHSPQEDRSARDIYRMIVRQLHPDHHGAMSEARKNLWHEAQEAYRRRDVAALHSVLARCDNGAAGLGPHTPVSLIRRLTAQLRQAIQSTRSEIRRMKTDPAWNFEERTRDPRYANQIRAELQSAIHIIEHELRSVYDVLARLERKANRPPRPSPASRRRPPPSDLMDEFLF